MKAISVASGAVPLPDLLLEFRELQYVMSHALSDISAAKERRVFYNCDYDLIYPWLWPGAESDNPQYDRVGRNIFSLYPHLHRHAPFKICFTVPTLLEFLDTIEHRHARYIQLSESREKADAMLAAFKELTSRDFDAESQQGKNVKSLVKNLKLGVTRTNFDRAIILFNSNILSLAHEHVDVTSMMQKSSSLNEMLTTEYEAVLNEMRAKRGPNDRRAEHDKEFHYKVDSWNIAFRLVNQFENTAEFAYVCREQIRQYFTPASESGLHSRNPLVLLYQLYGLWRAEESGSLQQEMQEFLEDSTRRVSGLLSRMEKSNLRLSSDLTKWTRNEVGEVHNTIVRPLIDIEYNTQDWAGRARDHLSLHALPAESMGSADALQDHFRARADELQAAAQRIADVVPVIVDDRLLGVYGLADNPRVKEIAKALKIE